MRRSAVSEEMCSQASPTNRQCYSPAQLLSLRQSCAGISRKTRRLIFSLGICNTQHVCSLRKSVPVRVTQRRRCERRPEDRQRELVRVPLECHRRNRRTIRAQPPSSMMLSNLRSISNKVDEVTLKIKEQSPEVEACDFYL